MKGILLIVVAVLVILSITAVKITNHPSRSVLFEKDINGLRIESIGEMDVPLIIDGEPLPFPRLTNGCVNGLCIER